ncbi:hypothetical protein V8F33_001733 [Rhypophila sp. PSN 637]
MGGGSDEEDEDLPDAESEPEEEISSDEEEEEEQQPPAQAYLSLMKSLAESAPNKAKRRKLDHQPSAEETPKTTEPKPQAETEAEETKVQKPQGAGEDPDFVDEADGEEEDQVDEAAVEDLFDEDDDLDAEDPFEVHFDSPKDDVVQARIKAIKEGGWTNQRAIENSMKIQLSVPKVEPTQEQPLPSRITGIADLKLKKRLKESMAPKRAEFDAVEQTVAPLLFNYHDLLYCDRTVAGGQSVRRMACLHALNHVFKTRDRIIKNNAKLSKHQGEDDLELRDQGFTRPKVLMILPTRQSCVKMVDMITSICEPSQQENRKRFDDSYVEKHTKFSDDKAEDFRDLFYGNQDDMFRLGLKFTRKTVKYFSQFYNSDIIFASPLGLRMAIGSTEEEKKLDYDFLSSIELVILDQADALLMQNWEHVEFIFEHLNLTPRESHGFDVTRARHWYLDDHAKYYRQTAIFSAFNTPELTELFRTSCQNWAGKARLQPEYQGVISNLPIKVKQTFSRFDAYSVVADPDARFEYFTKAILPSIAKRAKDAAGTLLFVPSYLDFVRVRNYFANNPAAENITFGTICEYTDIPVASRARSYFIDGRYRVLIYTERAHHFMRYQIKGVKRVIFYALPDNPLFYKEIAGGYLAKSEQSMLLEAGRGTVKCLFSRYDAMKLERIVGTKRVGKMIAEQGDTFDFV